MLHYHTHWVWEDKHASNDFTLLYQENVIDYYD